MRLQDFKVLTFDVVGTLIDFERGMLDYLRSVAPADAVGDDDFLAAYRKARKMSGTLAYPDDLERVLACDRAGPRPARQCGGSPRVSRFGRDWPAFPDSAEALRRLRGRFKLVTMTNAQNWALAHF